MKLVERMRGRGRSRAIRQEPGQSPAPLPGGSGADNVIDLASRAGRARQAKEHAAARRRHADEVAFLPAALEIIEAPPSPIGRGVIFTIAAAFAIAIAWASIGTVDIVAVAPGKIIPSGRTKIVQPFETGVVRAIHVRDGQSVKAGDVLIELDPTMSDAELGRLRTDLIAARLEAARLRAALSGEGDLLAAFDPPLGATPDLIQVQRSLLIAQAAEQAAKVAAIDGEIAQKDAERATIQAAADKLKATIPLLEERVNIRQHLFDKELGSKLLYLSEKQDLVGQRQDVKVQERRAAEMDAAIAALKETRGRTIAECRRGLFDELAKAEQKAAGLAQEVIKAEQRTSLQRLTAPVDGVVQQLAVHTIGGVVTPAQALMVVVPAESRLEIEAMVSNRDIGFVEAGQEAAIKVDTFNFTRYGLLHGKVLTVSHDAITRDRPPDHAADKTQGAEIASSEPSGQELVYATKVSLERTHMPIEGRQVALSPGMAVTVEIKTGSRAIISYLMSPLVRYRHDSLRER
jgi:hemolysin D